MTGNKSTRWRSMNENLWITWGTCESLEVPANNLGTCPFISFLMGKECKENKTRFHDNNHSWCLLSESSGSWSERWSRDWYQTSLCLRWWESIIDDQKLMDDQQLMDDQRKWDTWSSWGFTLERNWWPSQRERERKTQKGRLHPVHQTWLSQREKLLTTSGSFPFRATMNHEEGILSVLDVCLLLCLLCLLFVVSPDFLFAFCPFASHLFQCLVLDVVSKANFVILFPWSSLFPNSCLCLSFFHHQHSLWSFPSVLSWPRYKWPFADWVKAVVVVVGWTEGEYIKYFLFYCLYFQLRSQSILLCFTFPSVSRVWFPLHLLLVCVGHLLSRDLFYAFLLVFILSVVVSSVCFGYFII